MRKATWLIVGIVLVGVLFFPIEVRSINPHEGAIALSQPTLTSTSAKAQTFNSCTSGSLLAGEDCSSVASYDAFSGTVTGVDVNLSVPVERYEAPKPVTRPLYQVLFFGPGTIFTPPPPIGQNVNPVIVPPGGSAGCSASTGTASVSTKTYATFDMTQPNGEHASWTSDTQTWSVSYNTLTYSTAGGCSGGPEGASSWTVFVPTGQVTVNYGAGTIYFTGGCGGYDLNVKVFRVNSDGTPDTQIGTLSATLTVSPEGACSA